MFVAVVESVNVATLKIAVKSFQELKAILAFDLDDDDDRYENLIDYVIYCFQRMLALEMKFDHQMRKT